jgi:glycosyltransferase involved in cell wall biosynthesis
MKILHLTAVPSGGAWTAVRRIVDALNTYTDAKALILTHREFGTIPEVGKPSFGFRLKWKLQSLLSLFSKTSNPIFHSPGLFGAGLVDSINSSDADIVHLHWINAQFLSIRDIARIRKKMIWTLHDSWVFCGAEHHPNILENDRRWQDGYSCKNFPVTSFGLDIDKWIWLWKKHCWKNLDVFFTAPSFWEAEHLEQSCLFRSRHCEVIPNCIDTEIFSPGDKLEARKKWNLPSDRKIILFGAVSLRDPNKGGKLLAEAVKTVCKDDPEVLLLCFGKGDVKYFTDKGIDCLSVGSLQGDDTIASLYRCADVFVCPSIIENLPSTCVEALACGIPVTAFRTGGLQDIVKHQKTGFLAECFDTEQLAAGIIFCLANGGVLGQNAREYVSQRFSQQKVAEQFYAVYQQILQSVEQK